MSSKLPKRVGRPRKYANDRERWKAAQKACRARRKQQKMKQAALFSSTSQEWYTPPELIEGVLAEIGRMEFDCDPASPRTDGPIPARTHYTRKENGLLQPWVGIVWLNPPYGRQLAAWVHKAIAEIRARRAEIIYLLVPSRTDTLWWHDLMAAGATVQYLKGRIRFLRKNGERGDASPFPSVLLRLRQPAYKDTESGALLDGIMAATPQPSE